MKMTMRAAVAAIAFAAFFAQPPAAQAGGIWIPLWIASSALCEAIVLSDANKHPYPQNGVIVGRTGGKAILCLVPGIGLAVALADHSRKNNWPRR